MVSLSNVILNFWERASSSSWQSHDPGQLQNHWRPTRCRARAGLPRASSIIWGR